MLQNRPNLQVLYTDTYLADLFQTLDQLHTAVSEDQIQTVTPLNEQELIGWLRDLVYTAQETIEEIEEQHPTPQLRVLAFQNHEVNGHKVNTGIMR
jgi:hypothetical protein